MYPSVALSDACVLPNCPLREPVAIQATQIRALEAAVASIETSIARIEGWMVRALGAFSLGCLAAIFKLLHG